MKFPKKSVMSRYVIVSLLFSAVGIAVFVKAMHIIFVEGEYWMEVSRRFVKTDQEIPPTRGNILSADGQILAASLPEYRLYMDFMSWEKDSARRAKDQDRRDSLLYTKLDSICQGMHRIIPEIDSVEFRKHLLKGRKLEKHNWLLYPKRVSYIQYREAKKLPLFKLSPNSGGFHVREYKQRKNPYGRLAIRTIGDLYGDIDSARCGIELSFDSLLRGKPGKAHRRKVLNRYLTIEDEPAQDGYDVQTTLDVGMQDVCEKALGDKLRELNANSGVCILMEVATGDVKAITSLTRTADGNYYEIGANAVSNLYEPGSVFKPMSFMVAMDDGYISMKDQVDTGCGIIPMRGRNMKDHNWRNGGYGVLDVPMIIGNSSNIGVSVLIDKHYYHQPEKFVDGIYRIGVAEDLKLPIPGYAKPRIRRPLPDGSNWSKTALPWMSIGYETQIPPISTLTFYNGVANGGVMVRPRFVTAVLDKGQVIKEYPVEVIRPQMCKPEVLRNIQECLVTVTTRGVGKRINSRMFNIAGKTGTAQVWTKAGFAQQYLVTFAGYFPAEKPQYSCIVCIQKGAPASGGGHCGPVFKKVAETIMAQQHKVDYTSARDTIRDMKPGICPGNMVAAAEVLDYLDIPFHADFPIEENGLVWGVGDTDVGTISLKEDLEGDGLMPDLRGYGLRDAVFLLEKMGAKVKVKGVGRVMKQSIKPGKILAKGTEVVLDLGMTNSKKKSSAAVAPLATDSTAAVQKADSLVKKNISELPVQKKKTN